METKQASIAILLIVAISGATFLVATQGSTGAVPLEPYVSCCCHILANENGNQFVISSQVQTFEPNCESACQRYSGTGHLFAQEGLCVNNL